MCTTHVLLPLLLLLLLLRQPARKNGCKRRFTLGRCKEQTRIDNLWQAGGDVECAKSIKGDGNEERERGRERGGGWERREAHSHSHSHTQTLTRHGDCF